MAVQTEDGIPPLQVRQLFEVGEGGYVGALRVEPSPCCLPDSLEPLVLPKSDGGCHTATSSAAAVWRWREGLFRCAWGLSQSLLLARLT